VSLRSGRYHEFDLAERSRLLYLHGFASSPGSRKAQFFSEKLRERGLRLETPDLTQGRFRDQTISAQLRLIEDLLAGDAAILIGSSLGGYLAAVYAARHPEVVRVLLLAPAFGFSQLWTAELGPLRMTEWKERGELLVFHYGENKEVPLSYGVIIDATRWEAFPNVRQPALILHGTHDEVVPLQQSQTFVQGHPNARLVPLNSGHELTDVLEDVWNESECFLLPNAADAMLS
jgi:pimeloyl-ACP methyl ester carboxylesterase